MSAYAVMRVTVGGLLLTAAGLKAVQLATEPTLGSGLLNSRLVLVATVECELLFGFWLLANLWPALTRATTIGCFGIFACVSLYKAISGHSDCGCFGRVAVNPWYTATLDVAIIIGLLNWQPKRQEASPGVDSRQSFYKAIVVLTVWLSVGLPAALAMGRNNETTLSSVGRIVANGQIVVLEPRHRRSDLCHRRAGVGRHVGAREAAV